MRICARANTCLLFVNECRCIHPRVCLAACIAKTDEQEVFFHFTSNSASFDVDLFKQIINRFHSYSVLHLFNRMN